MKTIALTRTVILLSILASAVTAAGPDRTGALAVPANRIVGLWSTEAHLGPCGGQQQPVHILNTLLFHAGGTLVENPRFPPGGIAELKRGQALGTWTYNKSTRVYSIHLRFDNYVASVYDGYSIVDREMVLSKDGTYADGNVVSTRYFENGNPPFTVCGFAASLQL
jgi:hypothetical protein